MQKRNLVGKFVFAASLCLALPVAAVEYQRWDMDVWRILHVTEDNTLLFMKADSATELPATIARPFPVKQVWFGWDFQRVKGKDIAMRRALESLACSQRKMRTIASVSYDRAGKVQSSFNEKFDNDYDYEAVIPETLGEAMLDYGCGFRKVPGFSYCTSDLSSRPDLPACPTIK